MQDTPSPTISPPTPAISEPIFSSVAPSNYQQVTVTIDRPSSDTQPIITTDNANKPKQGSG